MRNVAYAFIPYSEHPKNLPSMLPLISRKIVARFRENNIKNTRSIFSHLRSSHCSREGGSFVCLYGENHVCSSLPVEGISDADYEQHIYKHHVFVRNKYRRHKRQASTMSSVSDISTDNDKWNVYSASQNLAAVLNNPNKMKQVKYHTSVIYCCTFRFVST